VGVKTALLAIGLFPAAVAPLGAADAAHPVLAIGAAGPDFHLPGVDGKTWSLADFRGKGVGFVVIQPDSPRHEDPGRAPPVRFPVPV
jgi:hypothetical protein